jgi:hypothetical protein
MVVRKKILPLFLAAALAGLLLSGCRDADMSTTADPGWTTFESGRFGFAVDYPADWPATVDGEDVPDSPDAGILLLIEGVQDNLLYIFGSVSTYNSPFDFDTHVSTEPFKTSAGLRGTVSLFKSEEEVRLIYTMDRYQLKEARHLGAIARMQPERYERAKETIDRIMDTLRQ